MADRHKPEIELKKSEIITRYMFGDSVIQLSKEYGLSRERIYQYLRVLEDWNEEQRIYEDRKKHQTKIQKQKLLHEIILLIKEGKSITQITRGLHIANKTVYSLLKGTKYKLGHCSNKKRDRNIYKEYKRGLSQVAIAQKYHQSQANISRIIRKHYGKLSK